MVCSVCPLAAATEITIKMKDNAFIHERRSSIVYAEILILETQ